MSYVGLFRRPTVATAIPAPVHFHGRAAAVGQNQHPREQSRRDGVPPAHAISAGAIFTAASTHSAAPRDELHYWWTFAHRRFRRLARDAVLRRSGTENSTPRKPPKPTIAKSTK